MPATWAIVVAAGRGERFGGAKQFARLGGRRLVDRSVAVARDACDAVVLVLERGMRWDGEVVEAVVEGGATRSASVRAGLAAVPSTVDVVIVHDAARALATPELFDAVVRAVSDGADAAVPGVPVVDTVKRVADDGVIETLSREGLVAVQTPQAFRVAVLRAAHERRQDASDDAALVEAYGGRVVVVPGDPDNLKVTTRGDLAVAEARLAARAEPDR